MSFPASVPPPRKRLRLTRLLLWTALLILAIVVGVVLFRQELATRAAVAYLESQGIAVRSLDVTRLTADAIEVSDLALGDKGELAADRIEITPNIDGLDASLQSVRIEGLSLKLDISGAKPLFGSLQPVIDRLTAGPQDISESLAEAIAKERGEKKPFKVPDITLPDAKVIFQTPSGPMTAVFEGTVNPVDDGGMAAEGTLDLNSDLGRLRAGLIGRRNADGEISVAADVADGRLAWQGFSLGSLNGKLSLHQRRGRPPFLSADLDLRDLLYRPAEGPLLALDNGRLAADGNQGHANVSLTLDGGGEHLDLKAEISNGLTVEGPLAAIDFHSELRTAGGLAQFLPLPGPKVTAGTLVLELNGGGRPSRDLGEEATWQTFQALLAESPFKFRGDAILGGVAFADGTTGVSAHLPLIAELADNRLTLTLREDAAVRVEKPARESLHSLGAPNDLLPLLASGLNLSVAHAGDLPFRLATTPTWPPEAAEIAVAAEAASDQGLELATKIDGAATLDDDFALARFDGSLEARAKAQRLSFGGREARDMTLTLPLTADYGADELHLALATPGTLRIGQFGAKAPLHLQEPLIFTIGKLSLDAAPGDAGYAYSLGAKEDGAGFAITAAGTAPIAIEAGALAFDLGGRFDPKAGHQAKLALRLGRLALPDYAVSTEAAEIDIALDRELRPATSRFSLGPFQAGGDDPLTAPLKLTGTLKRAAAGYNLAGELALSEGQVLADLTGRYGDDGAASLKAESRLLAFAPDGLQPAALSPLLANLENVSGSATASARFAWPRAPSQESGRVSLSNLSFKTQGVEVSGLDLGVEFDSLLPLASSAGERLAIRSIDAGVPVKNIEVVFSLDQAPRPHLSVEDGGFELGGARWRIEPTVLDPDAARNHVALATEGLDLGTFFDLIDVEGLSGSGRLEGRLPIVFAGKDIIVEDGRFEALEPGVLSLRIEALRSALAGGGATVEMAAKALEDFHYDELSLDLAKTADNDATVKLSTLGQNPAVLDGQPFRFNINLESNLTSVLDALRQGYSLSDDALRKAWRLRQ